MRTDEKEALRGTLMLVFIGSVVARLGWEIMGMVFDMVLRVAISVGG